MELAKLLMRAAEPYREGRYARHFAITLLAGLRPGEIGQLNGDAWSSGAKVIRVRGGKVRGRANRFAPVTENLKARFRAYPNRSTGSRSARVFDESGSWRATCWRRGRESSWRRASIVGCGAGRHLPAFVYFIPVGPGGDEVRVPGRREFAGDHLPALFSVANQGRGATPSASNEVFRFLINPLWHGEGSRDHRVSRSGRLRHAGNSRMREKCIRASSGGSLPASSASHSTR